MRNLVHMPTVVRARRGRPGMVPGRPQTCVSGRSGGNASESGNDGSDAGAGKGGGGGVHGEADDDVLFVNTPPAEDTSNPQEPSAPATEQDEESPAWGADEDPPEQEEQEEPPAAATPLSVMVAA